MAEGLFAWPGKCQYGRVIPKTKIYAQGRPSTTVKNRFVAEVDKITWAYKLYSAKLNLAATKAVPEIEVLSISLKGAEIHETVLRCIDKAVPHPLVFELEFEGKVKVLSAYKRPSDADSKKWVVGEYFGTDWLDASELRSDLPASLDLAGLYENILKALSPLKARRGEEIGVLAERVAAVKTKRRKLAQLENKLKNEKQFNRKVETNALIRHLNIEIKELEK